MILLPEQGVVDIWQDLTPEVREGLESNVFLVGGREQQHVLTDQEINTMIEHMNKEDLLNVLLVSNSPSDFLE